VNEEVIEVGALVDSVSEVFELNTNEIKQTPTLASRYRSDYVQGMIQENDHFIRMLDVDKVFSSNDLDSINIASEANVKLEETHTKE
jgi:purine-binding chemotaxis protein CheW